MSKVINLRKAGNLNEAFKLAEANLNNNPDDIWCKRDMAWVLYDLAKQKATVEYKELFLRCFDKLIELDMPENEEMFYQNAGFLLRGMASTMIRAEKQDNAFFDALFERLKLLKVKKNTPAFSSIITVMLRAKTWWGSYKTFVGWCGWDCFMDEDFNNIVGENGIKIMPLVERVAMAYCKLLLDNGLSTEIEQFLPILDDLAVKHKNYIYLPFYSAKLLWKIGKKDEYFDKMKVFARKKSGEFWVWDLLGDYYDDDSTRLKFYAKGLLCKSKAEMTVKLREKTAIILFRLGYLAEALSELKFVTKVRERNKWKLTSDLELTLKNIESQGITQPKNPTSLYESISFDVEKIVFGAKSPQKSKSKPVTNNEDSEEFEGKITIAPGGFGFVRFCGKTIFVSQKLIADHKLADKTIVKGRFVKSIDKKKNKEGYKAVSIE